MAILNQAKYLSFDHLYAETVTVVDPTRLANGVAAHRFVTRKGGYPAAAGSYAAGLSIYDTYGVNSLTGYNNLELAGSVVIAATTGVVTGVGTAFSTELAVGSVVKIRGLDYVVKSIASATSMVVERLGGAPVEALAAVVATAAVAGTKYGIYTAGNTTFAGMGAAAETLGTLFVATAAGTGTGTLGHPVTRLEAKGGYSVDSASLNLDYQDRMNTSNTPLAPRVFPYQRTISIVTAGVGIVEVAPSQTFDIDSPVYTDTSGRASTTAGAGVILGRSLDVLTTSAADSGFIRVRLAGTAN
jgi:hypothetical protein